MADENLLKWKILQETVFERKICDAFELFRNNNIEPILIKGWAAARNYPNPYDRSYTDIDFAVSENDYPAAAALVAGKNLVIDLHKELRHLDTVRWKDLYKKSRLITTRCCACAVRILSDEDHLRVLCTHWLNDGGAHRERLWDVYYAVANRPTDFDWSRCLEVVTPKRKMWVVTAIKLAEKYLGLDTRNTPISEMQGALPGWVVKTVEKEWSRAAKLKPLNFKQLNFKDLLEQIKIRTPPNPIQATVEMDEEFDDKPRGVIQLRNILQRLKKMFQ